MSDIKLLNGLDSGVADSPYSLSRIGFRIPWTTRSRDPYYLAPVKRNYLDDDPLRRTLSSMALIVLYIFKYVIMYLHSLTCILL